MVLPTILYGLDAQEQETLLKHLREVSQKSETPFRVLMSTDSIDDAIDSIRSSRNVSLVIIAVDSVLKDKNRLSVRLGHFAKQVNRDHYVVYYIKEQSELMTLLPLCARTAGLLVSPLEEKACMQVFSPLFEDYHKVYARDLSDDGKWINLKSSGKLYRIRLNDVCMVQAIEKMIEFHAGKQVISVYDTMDNVEKMLGSSFVRCHRSYLINQEQIQFIDFREMSICLTNGSSVPLARSFKESMQQKFSASKA